MNALRDWLNTQLGSDGGRAVQMILALIVVVVLLVALAWLFRRFSGSTHFGGRGHRLSVVDAAPVDGRRRLLLVRRDDVEHLVMIGGPNDLLVESRILRGPPTVAARPAGPVVTSVPTAVPAPSEEETRARSLPGAAALASAVASAGAFVRSRMNRSPAEPEAHRPIESPIDDDTLFDAPLGRAETAPPPPPPPRPKPIGEPVGAAPVAAAPQPPRGPRPPQNAQDAPLRQAPRPGAPQDGAPRAGAEPAVPPQPPRPPIRPRPPAPPQAADDGAAPRPVPAPVEAKPVQRAATEVVPAPVPPAPRPTPKPEPVVVIAPPMVAAAAVDVVAAPKPVPPPAPMPMPAPVPPPPPPAPSSTAARMEHADIAGEIERALSNLAAGPAPEPTQLEVDLLSELDLVVAASADRPKAVETAITQEAPPAPKPEPATERIEPRFAEPAPHDEPAAVAPPVAPPPVEAPHAPLDELEEEMARLLAEISGQQRR